MSVEEIRRYENEKRDANAIIQAMHCRLVSMEQAMCSLYNIHQVASTLKKEIYRRIHWVESPEPRV